MNIATESFSAEALIPHLTYNESGFSSIVLLHGLTSSPLEYTNVVPYLTQPGLESQGGYHILAPYLPAHGLSSHISPFSIPRAAELVAELIRSKGKEGTAHVVGLSLGGFVAVYLAKTYPTLVSSLFETGIGDFVGRPLGSWLTVFAPYVLFPVEVIQHHLPTVVYDWAVKKWGLQISDDLRAEMWTNSKFSTLKSAYRSIGKDGGLTPLPMRALAVAGGLQDSIKGTRAFGRDFRKGNKLSRACVVRKAIHAWDLQFPELFAQGVRAWVEERELPPEFEILELDPT